MKLKNKKTGEIIEVESLCVDTPTEGIVGIPSFDRKGSYNSLAELNAEWCDYEEPKKYYYINDIGAVQRKDVGMRGVDELDELARKEIGNYFETREEAEKAVEKLKAWKRLKDKGFEITEWKFTPDMKHIKGNFITIKAEIPYIVENQADLDLLFGGEE